MVRGLTARQQEVAEAIYRLFVRHGRMPTYHELCQVLGLRSSSTVWSHVRALEGKGILRSDPDKLRGTIAFSEVSLQRLVALIPEYLGRGAENGDPKLSTTGSQETHETVHKES